MRYFLPMIAAAANFLLATAEEAPQWTKVDKDLKFPFALRVLNEGIANDGKNWFFSQQHFLVSTTVDMKELQINYEAIPKELRDLEYAHIGDIDIAEGVIYGGLEIKGGGYHPGVLAKWRTSDLSLINYSMTTMDGCPWVAINPKTRLLYSAVWNNMTNLTVFNMDTLEPVGVVTVPTGLPGEIQGGAFWNDELYLSVNANCSVWKLNLQSLDISRVLSAYNGEKKWMWEMEGIDFWDLSDRGLGVMHMYGNYMGAFKSVYNYNPPVMAA